MKHHRGEEKDALGSGTLVSMATDSSHIHVSFYQSSSFLHVRSTTIISPIQMSKFDIRSQFEYQESIPNVKVRYRAPVGILK